MLSQRETMVMALVAGGLPNKAIGKRLGISAATVNDYINRAAIKLGAENANRTAAAVLWVTGGTYRVPVVQVKSQSESVPALESGDARPGQSWRKELHT